MLSEKCATIEDASKLFPNDESLYYHLDVEQTDENIEVTFTYANLDNLKRHLPQIKDTIAIESKETDDPWVFCQYHELETTILI